MRELRSHRQDGPGPDRTAAFRSVPHSWASCCPARAADTGAFLWSLRESTRATCSTAAGVRDHGAEQAARLVFLMPGPWLRPGWGGVFPPTSFPNAGLYPPEMGAPCGGPPHSTLPADAAATTSFLPGVLWEPLLMRRPDSRLENKTWLNW